MLCLFSNIDHLDIVTFCFDRGHISRAISPPPCSRSIPLYNVHKKLALVNTKPIINTSWENPALRGCMYSVWRTLSRREVNTFWRNLYVFTYLEMRQRICVCLFVLVVVWSFCTDAVWNDGEICESPVLTNVSHFWGVRLTSAPFIYLNKITIQFIASRGKTSQVWNWSPILLYEDILRFEFKRKK